MLLFKPIADLSKGKMIKTAKMYLLKIKCYNEKHGMFKSYYNAKHSYIITSDV